MRKEKMYEKPALEVFFASSVELLAGSEAAASGTGDDFGDGGTFGNSKQAFARSEMDDEETANDRDFLWKNRMWE